MLAKSLLSPADSVCYDLEDAVAPDKKKEARRLVAELLDGEQRPKGEVMVRVNAVGTGYEGLDLSEVLRTRHISAVALPKTSSTEHLAFVINQINKHALPHKRSSGKEPIRIIGMIENALGMVRVEEIARSGQGHLDSLLFAAEDYCADVGLTRTSGRDEMLYPRSRLVTAAKAFGLQAIDLVCVKYKDQEALGIECEEGSRLGFDGKQAIHPDQIEIIQNAYSPSQKAIDHALRIKTTFEIHDAAGKGAYSLDGVMIDAPMYKQAMRVLTKAKAARAAMPKFRFDNIKS